MGEKALEDLLRLAFSGELGAALAYRGHADSVSDPAERAAILRILEQELDHRDRVGRMLKGLGARPSPWYEIKFRILGAMVAVCCHLGGRFGPMYGAARLERRNLDEYVRAAELAEEAGRGEWVDDLLSMAEVEREHEA